MTKALSYVTKLVLAQSSDLTNREVADKLGLELERVKSIRRYHGVVYNKTPRDRGTAAKIAAMKSGSTKEVADQVGCDPSYVRAVRRKLEKGGIHEQS